MSVLEMGVLEMLPFKGSPVQLVAIAKTCLPFRLDSGNASPDDTQATLRLGNGERGLIQAIRYPNGTTDLLVSTANGRWNDDLRKVWHVLHAELVRQGLLTPIQLPYKAIFPLDFNTITTLIPQYFPHLRLVMGKATFRVWHVSNCSLRVARLPDGKTELDLQFYEGEKPDPIAQDVWEKLADYLTNRFVESALRDAGRIDDGQEIPKLVIPRESSKSWRKIQELLAIRVKSINNGDVTIPLGAACKRVKGKIDDDTVRHNAPQLVARWDDPTYKPTQEELYTHYDSNIKTKKTKKPN
jgi:hypothetical protein